MFFVFLGFRFAFILVAFVVVGGIWFGLRGCKEFSGEGFCFLVCI